MSLTVAQNQLAIFSMEEVRFYILENYVGIFLLSNSKNYKTTSKNQRKREYKL